jgi:replicative DNA helicase
MAVGRRIEAQPKRPVADYFDRQPPFDLQAEIGVLGSIVLLPDVLDDVVMILRPDDFYDDAHRKLFAHMCALHEASKKIDPTLLIDRLKSAGEFEAIGGSAYLSKIINAVPNAAHATYYAEIVRQKSTFRSLIVASTEILRDAYDEAGDAPQLLSQAEQKIFSILDDRGTSNVAPLKDIVMQAMDRLDARMAGTHSAGGCDCGFRELDAKMGGLHDGELVILAARPSMGKTAFAMNVAENVAHGQNIPVLFVSLEMSSIELADRLLCSVARVNGHRLRNGTVSQEDRLKLVDTASMLAKSPFFVDDSPSRTVTEIAAAARRIKRRSGTLGLIVIDYLQLIEPDNPKDPRQEQVAKIARRLKGLAREMRVPVMCLAQLNRQTEMGKENIPRLSHLRESGAIEQDADVVLFVHREEYYHRGEDQKQYAGQAQIIVAKQRNGPVGEVELEWLRDFTRFQDRIPDRLKEFDHFNDAGGAPGGF